MLNEDTTCFSLRVTILIETLVWTASFKTIPFKHSSLLALEKYVFLNGIKSGLLNPNWFGVFVPVSKSSMYGYSILITLT